MFDLYKLFIPITSNPKNTKTYIEILPCDKLKPFIRCFWGSPRPYKKSIIRENASIVIPDGCMDIIFEIDYTKNKISTFFYGINDKFFYINENEDFNLKSTFAIRFNFWSVNLFADESMKHARNKFIDVDYYFKDFKQSLLGILIGQANIEERIFSVEEYFLKKLDEKYRPNNDLINAVYYIIKSKGLIKIPEICNFTCIGQRKLGRIFSENIGLSPKKVTDIVRFQNIWQEMYYGVNINSLDITYKYNYNSQSHFINNFKKYFGTTPLKTMKMNL